MRNSHLKEDIWRCRLKTEDVPILKLRNQFWHNVLVSWCQFNCYNQTRVENQIIWYNSWIRVGGKPFFWKDIAQKGLKYVFQLFQDKDFKTEQQVWEQFGLSRLRYNSLKGAIPREWKDTFRQITSTQYIPIAPHMYDKLIIGKLSSREIYQYLNGDLLLIHGKFLKWLETVGPKLVETVSDFGLMFQEIYRITNIPTVLRKRISHIPMQPVSNC